VKPGSLFPASGFVATLVTIALDILLLMVSFGVLATDLPVWFKLPIFLGFLAFAFALTFRVTMHYADD
jgi:hypothetical protein